MVNVQKVGPDCRACGSTAQDCSDKIQVSSARCCTSCTGHAPASEPRSAQDSESSEV
jgi:hypothetical protein